MAAIARKPRTSPKTPAQKERAKRIIVEIIRQSGGRFALKTNLYKAFYHAHLRFAEKNAGYLSEWPIVRMPNGPGIDEATTLLSELVAAGILTFEDCGGYDGFSFALTEKATKMSEMAPEEVEAIKYGVRCVKGRSAAQVSKESHEKSRSWQKGRNGEELNIYADLSDDDEYRKRARSFHRVNPIMEEMFAQARAAAKRTSA